MPGFFGPTNELIQTDSLALGDGSSQRAAGKKDLHEPMEIGEIQIKRVYRMPATHVIGLRLLLRPNKNDIGIEISVEKITLKLAWLKLGDPLRPKAERDVMSRYATLSEQNPNRQRSNDCKAT